MKKTILIFITTFLCFCLVIGTRSDRKCSDNFQKNTERPEAHKVDGWWIEQEINKYEMKRLYDSVGKYGFEEGVRKYNLDTLDISDEELQALKETAHEIAVKYGYLLDYE